MEEQIKFLKELQAVMKHENEHDYDFQASPRFWTVGDYRMVPCPEGFEDNTHVHLPNREYGGDLEELLQNINSDELEDMSAEAQEDFSEIECDSTAIEWLQEHYDDDAYLVPVREEHFIHPNTMFLTKEEAKRHIASNKHHYSSKAHTYAMTAWRAPKVEKLIDILMNFDWESIKIQQKA